MILSSQIALACDGINIHTAILDHAISANGFATAESYEVMELECAERRLRAAADKIADQRKRLIGNENKPGGIRYLSPTEFRQMTAAE